MALPIDTLNSYVKEKAITDGFIQQVLTASPALDLMKNGKAHVSKMGGQTIKVDIDYDLAGTFSAWAGHGEITLPTNMNETSTEGSYTWGFYNGKDIIPYDKWIEVKESDDAIIDLAEHRLSLLANRISRSMEANLFAEYDGTTHTVFGLPDIISDSDPTNYAAGLGGITVADMSDWKAFTSTYDSTKALAVQMWEMWNKLKYYSGAPNVLFTTMDVMNKFAAENFDKSGFLTEDKVSTSMGFKGGSSFMGVPFVISDQMPAGTIYFVNTEYLKLVTHPSANFKSTGWQQISTNNLDKLNIVTLVYSLVCSKRNAMGKITGIS